MSERSESGGLIVAVGVILILVLLFVTGGLGTYIFIARQQATISTEALRARAAEMEARRQAEQAHALAEFHLAQSLATSAAAPSSDQSLPDAVKSVLNTQEQAWNAGKIDEFMEHYWKSDELTFSSGGKTTRGWKATLDRYQEKYPTPEKMGILSFGALEITPLGDEAALVLGQWKLDRETEPLTGNFSLVVRKIDGRWLIIHDHTSRLAE